ncbi:class I SAM-dependent methyltransferase [Haloarcula pelagica]|uniref:class I SAM-dependent methyltransferase n=1 Tax=Haloarcula pelagica TaxID=3033389 RepID=UPI0024C305EF|nr:class I SAM-dependent methyltransferase [Halomicroarcula sp. YJ-61-S]
MDVPETVRAALSDVPVDGRVCLEAGAGVGNTTAGLLDAGAATVYAVTNDRAHARTVRRRIERGHDRLRVLHSDLRSLPIADGSVELITAHGLCNVLPPTDLDRVVTELTRVATGDCRLVVDDYGPLPDDAAVGELFGLENAAASAVTGRPALSFYPSQALRRWFEGTGWAFERERTLLDPVPWTRSHLDAHAGVIEAFAAAEESAHLRAIHERATRTVEEIGSESVGRMYSLSFVLSVD